VWHPGITKSISLKKDDFKDVQKKKPRDLRLKKGQVSRKKGRGWIVKRNSWLGDQQWKKAGKGRSKKQGINIKRTQEKSGKVR